MKTELSFKEISLGEEMTNITKKEKEFMKSKAKTKKVGKKRVRARNSKGHYIKDDPSTPHNEAYGEKPAPKNNIFGIILAVLLIATVLFLGVS